MAESDVAPTAESKSPAPRRKQVQVPVDLVDRLEVQADARGVSVSKLVEFACKKALEAWESQDLDAVLG